MLRVLLLALVALFSTAAMAECTDLSGDEPRQRLIEMLKDQPGYHQWIKALPDCLAKHPELKPKVDTIAAFSIQLLNDDSFPEAEVAVALANLKQFLLVNVQAGDSSSMHLAKG